MVHVNPVVTVRDVIARRILQDEKSAKKHITFATCSRSIDPRRKIVVPLERDTVVLKSTLLFTFNNAGTLLLIFGTGHLIVKQRNSRN